MEVSQELLRPLAARADEGFTRAFLPLLLFTFLAWIVTVPVHELLHAAGCVLFGGSVGELTIRPLYGGGLLERVFPFVTSGGEYAGRLVSFDTHGSDLCYFFTGFLPFMLTIFGGAPLLVLAHHRRSSLLHAVGIVQVAVAVVSITGDFYEMGSIVVTRLMGLPADSGLASLIRGDDFFVAIAGVQESGDPSGMAHGTLAVTGALIVGLAIHVITLDISLVLGRRLDRKALEMQTTQV